MKRVEIGFPKFFITGWGEEVIRIPDSSYSNCIDVGSITAHELGHAYMGHRGYSTTDREHIQKELEAWVWAVSKRGVTKEDKEYLHDEIVNDAADRGISESEVADLLKEALRRYKKLYGKGRSKK